MHDEQPAAPDNTAGRVALWRALHLEVDAPPHVFEDEVGLKLAAPDEGWRSRPDMSPFTRPFRASTVVPSALRSWLARASSKTSSRNKPRVASGSTSSSERAWTPSPSAGRRSRPVCA